jgi:hypothetical protein
LTLCHPINPFLVALQRPIDALRQRALANLPDTLAEAYSTQADYYRHDAEGAAGAVDEPWLLLAVASAKLAEEAKARSQLN